MYKNFKIKAHWHKCRPNPYLLRMKLVLFFLLILLMPGMATVKAQIISLSKKSIQLNDAFREIKKQTGFNYLWAASHVDGKSIVRINIVNEPLERAIKMLLADLPLTYSIEKGTILVKDKSPRTISIPKPKQTIFLPKKEQKSQQQEVFKGIVVDSLFRPIAGVTITVLETKLVTYTDNSGFFELPILSPNQIVLFKSIGFLTQRIPFKDLKKNVILDASNSKLDEVQVMAYGTTSRRTSTGNITKVKGEIINNTPTSNPMLALEGRIPGLIVTQSSGVAGSKVKLQIRGRTQIDNQFGASEMPLIIIDGVPIASEGQELSMLLSSMSGGLSPFSMISPGDIESIEVLKDADATSIYGSRGASGVILITTKKGKQGNTTVEMRMRTGIIKARDPKLMDLPQYLSTRKEAFKNDNIAMTNANAYDLLLWDTTRTTNLADQLIGNTGHQADYQIGVSGGNELVQYSVRGAYNRETDITPKPKPNTMATFSSSLNGKLLKNKLSYSVTTGFSSRTNKTGRVDISSGLYLPPHFKLYNEDGSLAWNEGGVYIPGRDNPLASLLEEYTIGSKNITGNGSLNYMITPSIRVGSTFGYNANLSDETSIRPKASRNPMVSSTIENSSFFGRKNFNSWAIDPVVEFKKKLGEHNITLLSGLSMVKQSLSGSTFTLTDYSDEIFLGTMVGAKNFVNGTTIANEYKYLGAFARLTYDYNKTLFLNMSARKDGSSRFGPNYQYANFGAIGTAFVFTNLEKFKDNNILSFGKIRGSYGTVGNDKIQDYLYMSLYGARLINYRDSIALSPESFFKPDLHWELTKKLEFATDLQFINGKIDVSLSWYKQNTSDPLVNYPLPYLTGFPHVTANLKNAVIQNRGWELMLNTTNFQTQNFSWSTSFNLTIPDNRLLKYPDLEQSSYASKYEIGKPLDLIIAAQYLGVDSKTGLYKVADLNNSGAFEMTKINGDLQAAFGLEPEYYGGFQNNFSYKNFNLAVFFNYTKGWAPNWKTKLVSSTNPVGSPSNFPAMAKDRWQNEGQVAELQKYTNLNPISFPLSLYGQTAAAFSTMPYSNVFQVFLKNVNIGYQLPTKLVKSMGLQYFGISFQGADLWNFVPFSKVTAEEMYSSTLKPLKTYTVALDIKF